MSISSKLSEPIKSFAERNQVRINQTNIVGSDFQALYWACLKLNFKTKMVAAQRFCAPNDV